MTEQPHEIEAATIKPAIVKDTVKLTPDELAARRGRNRWLALALTAFVVLVGVVTVTRLSEGSYQMARGREAREQVGVGTVLEWQTEESAK